MILVLPFFPITWNQGENLTKTNSFISLPIFQKAACQTDRSPGLQVSRSPGWTSLCVSIQLKTKKQAHNKHTTSTQWNMNHESESEILFLNCVFDVLWEQFQWDYQISSQCSKVSWLSSSLTSNNFVKSPAGLFYWSPRPCWPRSSSWMSRLVPSCTGTPQTITYHTYAVCSLLELQTKCKEFVKHGHRHKHVLWTFPMGNPRRFFGFSSILGWYVMRQDQSRLSSIYKACTKQSKKQQYFKYLVNIWVLHSIS